MLRVRAVPGARKAGIRGIEQDMLVVAVTAIAEKGKANRAVAELLCKALDLRKSQVELLAGETARHKQFLIHKIKAAVLKQKIELCLGTN